MNRLKYVFGISVTRRIPSSKIFHLIFTLRLYKFKKKKKGKKSFIGDSVRKIILKFFCHIRI